MTVSTNHAPITAQLERVHAHLAHTSYDPTYARATYDKSHAISVAHWYIDEAEPAADHEPTPEAIHTYKALSSALFHQLMCITAMTSLRIVWTVDDPYTSSKQMFEEVNATGLLRVFKSSDNHPIWSPEENDIFRAVHDCLGHLAWQNSFSAVGEDAAYRSHIATLPRDVWPALCSETRGQNATFNYGPQLDGREKNTYARQSWLVSPSWVSDWNV